MHMFLRDSRGACARSQADAILESDHSPVGVGVVFATRPMSLD